MTAARASRLLLPAHHASARRWIVVLSQARSSAGSPSSERSTRRRVETPSTKASIAAAGVSVPCLQRRQRTAAVDGEQVRKVEREEYARCGNAEAVNRPTGRVYGASVVTWVISGVVAVAAAGLLLTEGFSRCRPQPG